MTTIKRYFVDVYEEIERHALAQFPNQSCGVIVRRESCITYEKCRNTAEDRYNNFVISDKEMQEAAALGVVVAVVHSHDNFPHASKQDMEYQASSGVPHGIVFMRNRAVQDICFFGDELPVQCYVGRPFYHGIYDCYGLVRDYLRGEIGITIKQYPREFRWWRNAENLLFDHLQETGFGVVDKNLRDLEYGDCILAKVHSHSINHCGICIGDGLLLHHLGLRSSSLSRIEPATQFDSHQVTHIVRHQDLPPQARRGRAAVAAASTGDTHFKRDPSAVLIRNKQAQPTSSVRSSL